MSKYVMMPYYHMYPFMGFGTGMLWLVVVLAIGYLVYKLIKEENILAPSKMAGKTAEDILSERYVKGELTREQYVQMNEDIKKTT